MCVIVDALANLEHVITALGVAVIVGAFLFVRKKGFENVREFQGASLSSNRWEASKKKGDQGYYYAHHAPKQEVASSDFRMNGPRRLDKEKKPLDDDEDVEHDLLFAPAGVLQKSKIPITNYSWSDTPTAVSVYIELEKWSEDAEVQLRKLSDTSIQVETVLAGDTYALVLSPLRAPVDAVSKKVSSKRLTIKLTKRNTTSSLDRKWSSLLDDSSFRPPPPSGGGDVVVDEAD